MIVPEQPRQFIEEFLPHGFALLAPPALTGPAAAGRVPAGRRGGGRSPAPVGVAVRVVGAGEWTLRIVEDQLRVEPGVANDVALQVSLLARDFAPLIVDPLRLSFQGAETAVAGAAPARNIPSGVWSRLGRWDEETVELLRRQSGRILVRVDDAGTSRNISLAPGTQPYSLESAECSIDCQLQDLLALQAKRGSPLDLFYSGKIRITGDAQIALAMAGLFL